MVETDLSSFYCDWYWPGPKLKIWAWIWLKPFFIKTYFPWPMKLKISVLKLIGCKIGANFVMQKGLNITYPWLLEIGDNVWIGEGVWIDNLAKVTIHDNVCVSQGSMLLTGNHNYKISSFDFLIGQIKLENGVWIGAQTVVCPDVTMRSHSVLSVGSVMTHDSEPYTIYQGIPAQPVKKRIIELRSPIKAKKSASLLQKIKRNITGTNN